MRLLHLLVIGIVLATHASAAGSTWATSLRPAFEAAVALTSEIQALEARKEEQFARRKATTAALPSGPSATLSARSDAPFKDFGFREYEGELAFPLWLPGERSAALGSAETAIVRLEAEIAFRRLDVARRVRDAYWMVVEQRERQQLADRRRSQTKALADDVRIQSTAGQSSPLDVILAIADLQDADGVLVTRNAELEQALIQFRALTGEQPPNSYGEQHSKLKFPTRHPRLILRQSAVAKAGSDLDVALAADRDRPEVGVGVRTSRADSTQPYDTSLGVRLRIPFAYEALNAPKRAAASAEVRSAEFELAAAERETKSELAAAFARLAGARKLLTASDARSTSLTAAFTIVQELRRVGQTPLAELIRARTQMFEAANARTLARVGVERARSDVNQALGLEP